MNCCTFFICAAMINARSRVVQDPTYPTWPKLFGIGFDPLKNVLLSYIMIQFKSSRWSSGFQNSPIYMRNDI